MNEHITLTCLVCIEDQGKLLVEDRLPRSPEDSYYGLTFPGGHIEPGEPYLQGAIREVQEETGLTVDHLTLCGIKEFLWQNERYIVLLFKTSSFTGTLQSSAEGRVFWVNRADLPNYHKVSDWDATLRLFDEPGLTTYVYQTDENGRDAYHLF